MIVQVYPATSLEDAMNMVRLGVDHIGLVVSETFVDSSIVLPRKACDIATTLRGKAKTSALVLAVERDEIARIALEVGPDILHITSSLDKITIDDMAILRSVMPESMLIMRSVPVGGPSSIRAIRTFAQVSDILMLDTASDDPLEIGKTGATHDWSFSRTIVGQVRVPVVLAGGLTPENVQEAISIVRPWGVDSMTGTSLHGQPSVKDWDKVARFVKAAKSSN